MKKLKKRDNDLKFLLTTLRFLLVASTTYLEEYLPLLISTSMCKQIKSWMIRWVWVSSRATIIINLCLAIVLTPCLVQAATDWKTADLRAKQLPENIEQLSEAVKVEQGRVGKV